MSVDTDPNDSDDGMQVIDDGTVDTKFKNRIVNARKRVDDREDDIFVRAPLSGTVGGRQELVQLWGTTVRQYLKTIEPILRSGEIARSDYYYNNIEIANEVVYPPDGETPVSTRNGSETWDIEWSKYYRDDFDPFRAMGGNLKAGPGFEPPEPRKITLHGLKDVIETEQIHVEWSVPLNSGEPFGDVAKPSVTYPVKKQWLEVAIRAADQFLQEEANIGLEIGADTGQEKGPF